MQSTHIDLALKRPLVVMSDDEDAEEDLDEGLSDDLGLDEVAEEDASDEEVA